MFIFVKALNPEEFKVSVFHSKLHREEFAQDASVDVPGVASPQAGAPGSPFNSMSDVWGQLCPQVWPQELFFTRVPECRFLIIDVSGARREEGFLIRLFTELGRPRCPEPCLGSCTDSITLAEILWRPEAEQPRSLYNFFNPEWDTAYCLFGCTRRESFSFGFVRLALGNERVGGPQTGAPFPGQL